MSWRIHYSRVFPKNEGTLCLGFRIFIHSNNKTPENSRRGSGILGFYVPLERFSLIWRHHHCRWMAANFDLYKTLMAIEQWGFLSVPHLLWHGHPFKIVIFEDLWHLHLLPSVWQWSCHYLFFTTMICYGRDANNPNFCMQDEHSNRLRHCRG